MKRMRVLTSIVLLGLVLAMFPAAVSAQGTPVAKTVPRDLMAYAVSTNDMTGEDFAVYSGSSCFTADGCLSMGMIIGFSPEQIEASGLVGIAQLTIVAGGADGMSFNKALISYIAEFTDAKSAEAGRAMVFPALPGESTELPLKKKIGNISMLEKVNSLGSGAQDGYRLQFRKKTIVAGLDLANFDAVDPNAPDQMESLARLMLKRIDRPNEIAGLGAVAVHHGGFAFEQYYKLGGEMNMPSFDPENPFSLSLDELGQDGLVDVFESTQALDPGVTPSSSLQRLILTLYRFEDEASAGAFAAGFADRAIPLMDNFSTNYYGQPASVPALGDESTAVLWAMGAHTSAALVTRKGDVVIVVEWKRLVDADDGEVDPSRLDFAEESLLQGAAYTMELQLEALETGEATGVVEVPADLLQ